MSYVTKRDGSKAELNLEKLHKVVFWATEGLTGVSASEVEMCSQLQFYNNIRTVDIQETLIKAAADLISEESPNYQHVAGRLVNYHLRKEVYNRFQPTRLYDLIQRNVELGFYDPELLTLYTEEEWDEINGFVNHERDMALTYAAMEQMRGKYLVQNRVTKQILETPQVLYILVAAVLFACEEKETRLRWVRDYYEAISKHEISLPTPIMAGVRTPIRQYSSCFPAGQLVYTKHGFSPIEAIAVGDMVLTKSGAYHSVIATQTKQNKRPFVSFTHNMFFDDSFKTTSDHRLWALRKKNPSNRRKYSVPEWIEAGSLQNGDFVHVPVNKDVTPLQEILISELIDLEDLGYQVGSDGLVYKKIANPHRHDERSLTERATRLPNSIQLNEHFHRIIGYYLAEGHILEDKCVVWTFGSHEIQWIDDVVDYLHSLGYEPSIKVNKDHSTSIAIYSKIFARFIHKLAGNGFSTKILHSLLMRGTIANQKAILTGVIRGDGCVHRLGMTMGLSNRELVQQLAHIAIRCGLFPTLSERKPNGKVTLHPSRGTSMVTKCVSYGLHLAAGPNFDFLQSVRKSCDKMNYRPRTKYGISKYLNGEFYTRVRNVRITEDVPSVPVYDIQVDNDQSFTVANVSVHNCVLVECDDSLRSINETNAAIVNYVSQRAGIGLGAGRIRAIGSPVRNGDTSHTGVTPFYKMFQAAVNSCNQGGVRKGSCTLYVPVFHLEIETILVLKNNKGIEDNRVRHIDYNIQFNRLFYERLIQGGEITLFSPHDVPEMYEAFFSDYDHFKELYETAERNTRLRKKRVKALDLFSAFINERKDTGRIYLMNVDNANTHSSFIEKLAPVRMSNFCCEITQASTPMGSSRIQQVTVAIEDLTEFLLEQSTSESTTRLISVDDHQAVVEITEDTSRIPLCTLSAINWGVVKDTSQFERIGRLTIRALDNLLDYQDYPVFAARKHTEEYRPLGVGIINFAYFLAKNGVKYSDGSALELVDEWTEAWSYYLIKASIELAKERGPCKLSNHTKYHLGIMPIDTRKPEVDQLVSYRERLDWDALREAARTYGIRNATVTSIMPAETSAQVSNSTNGIEPPRYYVSVKQSKDGVLKQVVPEIRKLKHKYELLWDQHSPEGYLQLCAVLQKYIDQSISANTSYNPRFYEDEKIPVSEMLRHVLLAYRWGIKTLYYNNVLDGQGELNVSDMIKKTDSTDHQKSIVHMPYEEETCDSCTI